MKVFRMLRGFKSAIKRAGIFLLVLSIPAFAQNTPTAPTILPPTLPDVTVQIEPSPPSPITTPDPKSTLIATPGDTNDVQEVVLPAKDVIFLAGQSTWEEGFKTLSDAFKRLEDELKKAGLAIAGRPLSVFVETSETGFKFEAMLPFQKPAGALPALNGYKWGVTPSGKAYRFVHRAPYDDIDSIYETITAYLEIKGIVAKDAFIEEYVTDLKSSEDESLEINVFVQPK
jgi:effector-binding domain-containing protein